MVARTARAVSRSAPAPSSAPAPGWTARLPEILAGIAAVAVFTWAYLRLWGFIQDDVFISARYAHHLAEGLGLVYNRGSRVEGYTNFLYTVLLAVPFALHLAFVPFLKIANALIAVLAGVAILGLGHAVMRDETPFARRWMALIPALLFLVTPATIVSAAEGLETMLFTLLLVGSVLAFLEESPDGFPWSGLALAALAMTRPDGAAFVPWVLAWGAFAGRPKRHLLRTLLVFAVAFGAYGAARWSYYGHPLPNTFYAKVGGSGALLDRGWRELIRFTRECGGWAWLVIPLAFVSARHRLTAILLAGLVLVRFAFQLWSGGALMDKYRFLIPVLPFLHLLVVLGVANLVKAPRSRAVALAAVVAVMLIPGWRWFPEREANVLAYGAGLRHAHLALGQRVAAHTSPDAVIAMDDAGLGPLTADRENVDMLGLNDEHIAHLPGGYGKIDVRYVLGRRPDLIVLISTVDHPSRPEDFHLEGHARIFLDPEFQRDYRYARDYVFGSNYHLIVYRRTDSRRVPADF